MSATASCKFPFLDKWKEISNKNKVLSLLDEVLSGFAQIAFNDNSFAGLLMIVATFIASPVQAISGVWTTFVATITAHTLGLPKDLIKIGLYGFNAALAGLAIPTLVFPGSGVTIELLIYSGLAAIFTVVLTTALGQFLSKWDVPSLALPYSIALFIFVPAALAFGGLDAAHSRPEVFQMVSGQTHWTAGEYVTASLNGIAQVLWVDNSITGILYLVAVLMASRIDVISTIIGTMVSTAVAVALGLPKDLVIIGLFGYNAVLLMKVITRGFIINERNYIFAILLAALTTIFAAGLRVIFAPIGAVSALAFPYVILCILTFLGRSMFNNSTYVPARNWGVPETILKEHREQELSSE